MLTNAARDGKHVALTKCFFCLKDNAVLLHKRLEDVSRFHGKVVDMTPCPECAEHMKTRVILIGMDNARSEPGWHRPPSPDACSKGWLPNPYRTGNVAYIRDAAVEAVFNDPGMNAWAIEHRWIFVEQEALDKLEKMQEEAMAAKRSPLPPQVPT